MIFSVIIVAAGSSSRAGPGAPKPWRELAGKPVLSWSIDRFVAENARQIVVVVAEDRIVETRVLLSRIPTASAVLGGASRAASVEAGLKALSATQQEIVLVHDAARPFVSGKHISDLLVAMDDADGAIPALAVADTLKRVADPGIETISREGLWRAQTPQAFRHNILVAAYGRRPRDSEPTDDAAVVEHFGGRVVMVAGDPMLMKLTYPEDFVMAERLSTTLWQTRIGQGLDAHRWGPGDHVWLCGIKLAHSQSLVGHSDADAGLHAVTDAVLGAMGDGDIGEHFPPSDPAWKGASSDQFLAYAVDRLRARGGRISNVDVTLVCEQPKIAPHRQAMRVRLADLLSISIDRVSVKATTMEGMGFTGRGEGLVAQAIALIEMPS